MTNRSGKHKMKKLTKEQSKIYEMWKNPTLCQITGNYINNSFLIEGKRENVAICIYFCHLFWIIDIYDKNYIRLYHNFMTSIVLKVKDLRKLARP